MARLGSRVTCLERGDRLMCREDPDAVAVLQKQLLEDGTLSISYCQYLALIMCI